MENLRFDKEDYFHVLVFCTGYFIKEIENIFSHVPIEKYRVKCSRINEILKSASVSIFIIKEKLDCQWDKDERKKGHWAIGPKYIQW